MILLLVSTIPCYYYVFNVQGHFKDVGDSLAGSSGSFCFFFQGGFHVSTKFSVFQGNLRMMVMFELPVVEVAGFLKRGFHVSSISCFYYFMILAVSYLSLLSFSLSFCILVLSHLPIVFSFFLHFNLLPSTFFSSLFIDKTSVFILTSILNLFSIPFTV